VSKVGGSWKILGYPDPVSELKISGYPVFLGFKYPDPPTLQVMLRSVTYSELKPLIEIKIK